MCDRKNSFIGQEIQKHLEVKFAPKQRELLPRFCGSLKISREPGSLAPGEYPTLIYIMYARYYLWYQYLHHHCCHQPHHHLQQDYHHHCHHLHCDRHHHHHLLYSKYVRVVWHNLYSHYLHHHYRGCISQIFWGQFYTDHTIDRTLLYRPYNWQDTFIQIGH